MTTGDDGAAAPRKVHVSELLAANGRTAEPSGRRRRRAESDDDEVTAGSVTVLDLRPATVAPATVVEPGAALDTPTGLGVDVGHAAPERAAAAGGVAASAPAEVVVAEVDVAEAVAAEVDVAEVVVAEVVAAAENTVPAERSPAQEWALVGVQTVGALAGGAGLWFGFRWLWDWHSVVALVLSAAVIVGLVVVVRVLRRAEDLFSTVLAVLAGLIITVSPPVLTLTGR